MLAAAIILLVSVLFTIIIASRPDDDENFVILGLWFLIGASGWILSWDNRPTWLLPFTFCFILSAYATTSYRARKNWKRAFNGWRLLDKIAFVTFVGFSMYIIGEIMLWLI